MIQITDLTKTFTDGTSSKTIFEGISLNVAAGESVSITGESGSGKSTLLNILASLEKPDYGTVKVNHNDISNMSEAQADVFRREDIGIVFQQYNLIDCLSVIDNITLPARLNKRLDMKRIQHLLNKLGISALTHKQTTILSGGEQQRTSIARALAHQPKIVLADEPTGNLDDKNSALVANLLFDLCRQHRASLILVTHSQTLAAQADRHLHLENGKLVEKTCSKA